MATITRRRSVLTLACVVLLGGCAAPLPTYPWADTHSALALMARRADAIRTFASPCSIYIQRPDGYSVSLDGAAAAQIPGWLRIRAWKFGNAVFDLTVTPEGIWLLRDRGDGPESAPEAGPRRLAEAWSLLTGRFFEESGSSVTDEGGNRFTIQRPLGDGEAVVFCEVDRATLTARTFTITEPGGAIRLRLGLERYREVGDTVWPRRLVAEIAPPTGAGRGGSGAMRVVIAFEEPEINTELPPAAFVPPRRAVKQP
jgi:hypothetical protein